MIPAPPINDTDRPVEFAQDDRIIARVVLVPAPGGLAPLDYRLPAGCGAVAPGTRVLVPLGTRRSMGVVIDAGAQASDAAALRDIIAVLDPEPVLDASLLKLVHWMADYYLAALGEVFATALPGALRIDTERVVTLQDGATDAGTLPPLQQRIVGQLASGDCNAASLSRLLGTGTTAALRRLQQRGVVRIVERLRREAVPTRRLRVYESAVRVDDDDARLQRRPALQALYRYLRDHPLRRAPAHELRNSFANAHVKLRALSDAGLVRMREEETYRVVLPPVAAVDRPVRLTAAQETAVDAVVGARGRGVRAMAAVGRHRQRQDRGLPARIAGGIARARAQRAGPRAGDLAHASARRPRARALRRRVAVLHSQLGDGERWDEWRRIARGEAPHRVGARSAVFAPLRDLGLIIVDEEHDPAYKQTDGVHYHGRDVAVMRAKLAGVPVDARLGDAVDGELLQRPAADAIACSSCPIGSRSGRCRRCRLLDLRPSAGRRRRCRSRRARRRAGGQPRRRRAEPAVPQPARLRQLPAVPRLRRSGDVPELQRDADVPPALARVALPLLRPHRAAAGALRELRRAGTRDLGRRHRAVGSAAARAPARRAQSRAWIATRRAARAARKRCCALGARAASTC